MPDTAPTVIWRAFGCPAPGGKTGGKYRFEPCEGLCATCAAPIAEGVPFEPRRGVAGVNNDTFFGHAEYARWGTHVCPACAWMYGDPKRTHRGVLAAVSAAGAIAAWPVIDKPIDGRPRWRDALAAMRALPPETPMTGVLTTDPKPRLWPRAGLATLAAPALYIHAPDRDWSRWATFDWESYDTAIALCDKARAMGAMKAAIWRGLLASAALSDKVGLGALLELDNELAPRRGTAALLVAVLVV